MSFESDHLWTQAHLATALADGLTPQERARLEAHKAKCDACAQSSKTATELDDSLRTLFHDQQPAANFETRLIDSLRTAPAPRKRWIHPIVGRTFIALAATIALVVAGHYGSLLIDAKPVRQVATTDLPVISGIRENATPVAQPTTRPTISEGTTETQDQRVAVVGSLTRNSRQLIAETKYNEALGVLDQILLLDPGNDYAIGVKPLVEDRALISEQRVYREDSSRQYAKQLNAADEKKILYDDILRFPNNWPDIHELRDQTVANEAGIEQEDVAVVNSLERRLPEIRFEGASLTDVADFLRDTSGANIFVNWRELEKAGVDRNAPVTAQLKDVKFKQALSTILEKAGGDKAKLAYTIDEGVITISTKDDLRSASNKNMELSDASGGGYKLAQGMSPDFAVMADINTKPGRQDVWSYRNSGLDPKIVSPGYFSPGKPATIVQREVEDRQFPLLSTKVTGMEAKATYALITTSESGEDTPATTQPVGAPAPATVTSRVIRTGDVEFEVDSFDSAAARIVAIVKEQNGVVTVVNSEKLENGKVKGTIVVRVPPEGLGDLVLKLRALGDLKSQRIGAQDISKQYTDLESQLKAARAMEERLLEIIKTGKGEIKDLVAAEKELGVWREKIERVEGEIRYYNNQIALSTLTIALMEKNIATPAALSQTETINAGVEVEDVEKARNEALAAIETAKGRVIGSDLKKFDAGQLAASIVADVPPAGADAVVDRLKQLGKVARLDVQRTQTATDASATAPSATVRLESRDTRITISLYNLVNVAPRETVSLNLACDDVEKSYQGILSLIVDRQSKAQNSLARVVTSTLNRPRPDQVTGSVNIEVETSDASNVEQTLKGLGEVMRLSLAQNPDTANSTLAKRGFVVQLFSIGAVQPREIVQQGVACANVANAYEVLLVSAKKLDGRIIVSQMNEQNARDVAGYLDVEIRRDHLAEFEAAIKSAGDTTNRNAQRSADTENTLDTKVQFKISLTSAERLAPRQSTSLGIEVTDPEKSLVDVQLLLTASSGRVLDSKVSKDRNGKVLSKIAFAVPMDQQAQVQASLQKLGTVRMVDWAKNPQTPDGGLARARFDVTLANAESIVAPDDGLGATFRSGLGTSLKGLLISVQWLIVGVCLVGPWALVMWIVVRVIRRKRRTRVTV